MSNDSVIYIVIGDKKIYFASHGVRTHFPVACTFTVGDFTPELREPTSGMYLQMLHVTVLYTLLALTIWVF